MVFQLEDKIVRFGEKFTVWSGNENCKSCEFIDPLGNKYQNYKNMPCALVKLFKRSEAGEWTTLCNVEGNTKPLVFKFNLIVEGNITQSNFFFYVSLIFFHNFKW